MNCWRGLQAALVLLKLERLPRHTEFACPLCKISPQQGAFWVCGHCRTAFDTFQTLAMCPGCGARFSQTRCVNCGGESPLSEWFLAAPVTAAVIESASAPPSFDRPQ